MPGGVAGVLLGIAALALAFAFLWSGWCLACRLLDTAGTSARAAAAVALAAVLAGAEFCALLEAGLFRPWSAIAAAVLVALVLHARLGRAAWARARGDAAALPPLLRLRRRWPLVALAAVAAVPVAIRTVRATVSPPLAWDTLTYHAFRAGQWARGGPPVPAAGPDAWGYYAWFPRTADAPWAWGMLLWPDGALLAVAGALLWGGLVLACYAWGRALGGGRSTCACTALALGCVPAVANTAVSGYVDTGALALFVAGMLGATLLRRAATPATAVGAAGLAGAALGGAVAVRPGLAPVLAVAVLLAPVLTRQRRAALALAAFALVPVGLEYGPTWVRAGSPVWPLPLRLPGATLAPGHPELEDVLAGRMPGLTRPDPGLPWLGVRVVLPARAPDADELGLGIASPVAAALGLAGMAFLARRRWAAVLVLPLLSAVLVVTPLLAPDTLALRTIWVHVLARFLAPALACIAIAGAVLPGRAATLWWAAVVLIEVPFCWPGGWSAPAVAGVVHLTVLGAVAGLAAIAAAWLCRGALTRSRPAIAVVVAVAVISAALPSLRAGARYPLYAAAAAPVPAYEVHALDPLFASAFPIWRALDEREPHRVAVSAGWDGLGHNVYLYPLLGSRLQNDVQYVPLTRDRTVVDLREGLRLERSADLHAWLANLLAARIDRFVALPPAPPERAAWVEALPEVFRPVLVSPEGPGLWEFRPDAARRALALLGAVPAS